MMPDEQHNNNEVIFHKGHRPRSVTWFSKWSDWRKRILPEEGSLGHSYRARTVSSPTPSNPRPEEGSTSTKGSGHQHPSQKRSIKKLQYYGNLEIIESTDCDGRTVKTAASYRVEPAGHNLKTDDIYLGDESCPSSPVMVEDPENEIRWYYRYFLGKEHQNFAGIDVNKNPFFISVVVDDTLEAGRFRAIMWQNTGIKKLVISDGSSQPGTSPKRMNAKSIIQRFPNLANDCCNVKEITEPKLQKDLLILEEQEVLKSFKFGVVFSLASQKSDDEMLSNEFNFLEHGSENFQDFVKLLGDEIKLQNWSKYRGGLDVKSDSTGATSIYTNFKNHEIMFHIATLLPYSTGNRQQLERKRHIGNDIVNVIFEEGGDPEKPNFKPSFVKSKFTHIFAVVTLDHSTKCYRLWVYSEKSVPAYGPALPNPCEFHNCTEFRDFLLTKIINGEKAAFRSKVFAEKRYRTTDTLIKDMYMDYMKHALIKTPSQKIGENGAKLKSIKYKVSDQAPINLAKFLELGEQLKNKTSISDAHPLIFCTDNLDADQKRPWEPNILSTDFPTCIVTSSDSWNNQSLICATDENGVFLINDDIYVTLMEKNCSVQQINVVENFDLFLARSEKGKDAFVCAFSLQYIRLCIRAQKIITKKDCIDNKIHGTKVTGNDSVQLSILFCVGRKLIVNKLKTAGPQQSSTNPKELFEFYKEMHAPDEPFSVCIYESGMHPNIKAVFTTKSDLLMANFSSMTLLTVNRFTSSKISANSLISFAASSDLDSEDILLTDKSTTLMIDLLDNSSEPLSVNWSNNPKKIAYCFPFMLAFGSDTIEIRLAINGNLFASLNMLGVLLLASKDDIFFSTKNVRASAENSTKRSSNSNISGPSTPPINLELTKRLLCKISLKNLLKGGRTIGDKSKNRRAGTPHGSGSGCGSGSGSDPGFGAAQTQNTSSAEITVNPCKKLPALDEPSSSNQREGSKLASSDSEPVRFSFNELSLENEDKSTIDTTGQDFPDNRGQKLSVDGASVA